MTNEELAKKLRAAADPNGNIDIGTCWNLMESAADALEAPPSEADVEAVASALCPTDARLALGEPIETSEYWHVLARAAIAAMNRSGADIAALRAENARMCSALFNVREILKYFGGAAGLAKANVRLIKILESPDCESVRTDILQCRIDAELRKQVGELEYRRLMKQAEIEANISKTEGGAA